MDDSKVSDHHAIIPTEQYVQLDHMTVDERRIYDLVVRRFLAVLYPAEEYEQRGENIWIARDAKIFDSAYIAGPCIIDHGAELRQCAFVRGNAIVGKNAVVGNSCELKNVVLFDSVQTPHFNYVGDSILGY